MVSTGCARAMECPTISMRPGGRVTGILTADMPLRSCDAGDESPTFFIIAHDGGVANVTLTHPEAFPIVRDLVEFPLTHTEK